MNLQLMDVGTAEEHQGASHAAKHYLAPRELWQDVAQAIPSAHWPTSVLTTHFVDGLPWDPAKGRLTAAAVERFGILEQACTHGYLRILEDYLSTGIEGSAETLTCTGQKIRVVHLGDGIILQAWVRANGLRMRTAFRATGVFLESGAAYALVPYHAEALTRRLKQSRARARRYLADKQAGHPLDEGGES